MLLSNIYNTSFLAESNYQLLDFNPISYLNLTLHPNVYLCVLHITHSRNRLFSYCSQYLKGFLASYQ